MAYSVIARAIRFTILGTFFARVAGIRRVKSEALEPTACDPSPLSQTSVPQIQLSSPRLSEEYQPNLEVRELRTQQIKASETLAPDETVEVLSATEILATLDAEGKLEGLPFMPEMLRYCGGRFRVFKRADSTCSRGQPRRLSSTVHLNDLRCAGSSHGDCDAACLLLWKEAWLRRLTESSHRSVSAANGSSSLSFPELPAGNDAAAYAYLARFTRGPNNTVVCQATGIREASSPLQLGSFPVYCANCARGVLSRKLGTKDLHTLATYLWGKAILFAFTRWTRAPWNAGKFRKTPSEKLDLHPGESVQVRSLTEILRTLDRNGCNRGMEFKAEMFQFCGKKFRVLSRMRRRVDEHTNQMREFHNECIILDSVYCRGQRSFCARSNYHYWREIWLQRC